MVERQRFATSIGASALIHLLVVSALFLLATAPKAPISLPSVEVDLASLPLPQIAPPPAQPAAPAEAKPPDAPVVPLPQRQIVDPSDAGEEKEPEDTRLLSDRNNVVPEEMVRHGDQGLDPSATDRRLSRPVPPAAPAAPQAEEPPQPAPAVQEPPPPKAPPAVEKARPPKPEAAARPKAPARRAAPPEPEGDRVASLPKLDSLLPSAADLAMKAPAPRARSQEVPSGRDLLNSGEQVFAGRPGTRDLLPRVREGNITLLNTKADLFAPFVRRVAGRIFENLDLALSNLRRRRGVGSGRAVATVEAVMDRNGRFVGAKLVEHSGTDAIGVDRMLLGSATPDTFFDANPPAGAEANDGNIHFVLLVDLQVETAADPRSGREGVSYYGVAGVGLK